MGQPGDPLVVGHIYVPEVRNGYKIAGRGGSGIAVVCDICVQRGGVRKGGK